MRNQRTFRYLSIPLFAMALVTALIFLIANNSTPVAAIGIPDWQQTHGNQPMTHTMPMTHTGPMTGMTPPMNDHSQHQGAVMADKQQGMMDNMPMHQADMSEQMTTMGRRLQMMGMMMQMMEQQSSMMEMPIKK